MRARAAVYLLFITNPVPIDQQIVRASAFMACTWVISDAPGANDVRCHCV
jgi:hypothetical protein